MGDNFVHPTAVVDLGAKIGADTKIWHFSHIFSGAVIGERCSFGQNTMVANEVTIGNNVKVQNNVSIYSGTTIEDDVFLGPSSVLTNVSNPRSQIVRRTICEITHICRGATVGANATIVCGVRLGNYCFVAAGAVVTRDIPDYGFVAGVPAKQRGWMSRHGHPLDFSCGKVALCPESHLRYQLDASEENQRVCCIDLDEHDALPGSIAYGTKPYRSFRSQQ